MISFPIVKTPANQKFGMSGELAPNGEPVMYRFSLSGGHGGAGTGVWVSDGDNEYPPDWKNGDITSINPDGPDGLTVTIRTYFYFETKLKSLGMWSAVREISPKVDPVTGYTILISDDKWSEMTQETLTQLWKDTFVLQNQNYISVYKSASSIPENFIYHEENGVYAYQVQGDAEGIFMQRRYLFLYS